MVWHVLGFVLNIFAYCYPNVIMNFIRKKCPLYKYFFSHIDNRFLISCIAHMCSCVYPCMYGVRMWRPEVFIKCFPHFTIFWGKISSWTWNSLAKVSGQLVSGVHLSPPSWCLKYDYRQPSPSPPCTPTFLCYVYECSAWMCVHHVCFWSLMRS